MFRKLFVAAVEKAEKTWEKPESVFQHIEKVLNEQIEPNEDERIC